MGILNAINAPIDPPIIRKINTYIKPVPKLPTDKKVTIIAIVMPAIPK